MGGGSSSSSTQKTDQSTTITETVTTTLGDVGLTGKDAVALADVVNKGVLAQTAILTDLVNPVLEGQGKVFSALGEGGSVELKTGKDDIIQGVPDEFLMAVAAGVAIYAITKV